MARVKVPKRFRVVSKDDKLSYTRRVYCRSYELVYGPRHGGGYVTVDVDWYEEDGVKRVDIGDICFGVLDGRLREAIFEWVLRDLRKDGIGRE